MTTLLVSPRAEIASAEASLENARREVWSLLAGMFPERVGPERRAEERFPYPRLIHVQPVAVNSLAPVGPPMTVVGKHLSLSGIGFYHPLPLPYRRVVVSLEDVDGRWVGFLVDIAWCRFSRPGWYDSGGRFLQVVPSPMQSAA